MNIVYKIVFNDRIKAKTPPYYYIGSKTRCSLINGKIIGPDNKPYYGSSRWKNYNSFINETTQVEVLEKFNNIDHGDLLIAENTHQRKVNAKTNPEYFNKDYACGNNSYCNSDYATYKHNITGKCVRLKRNDSLVKNGTYVGVTTGTMLSKTHRQNISNGISGGRNGFYGKHHTEATIKILSEKTKNYLKDQHPRQKPVIANGKFYRGVRPAARELGISPNTVINRIKSGLNDWKYA